jgi:hypothetical protein
MWLFLRRHVSAASAALGAIVFSASGPVVSSANFPNLSWSIAWIPWIFWAADRDRATPRWPRFALTSAMIALQMLSGEPVTMVGTTALLVAYAYIFANQTSLPGGRVRGLARAVGAVGAAAAVSLVQLVPMAVAASASPRGLMRADSFWSIHPLWLVETVLPGVFGDTFLHYNSQLPWITPLNSGRDPFFYSTALGGVSLLLAALGALSGPRRWRFFWPAVVVASVVLACGDYTPIYGLLQRAVPVVRSFRFPAKFLVFAVFGVATLAATAVDVLQADTSVVGRGGPSRQTLKAISLIALGAAFGFLLLIALVRVVPFTGAHLFHSIGVKVGVADPVAGAEYLFTALPSAAARSLLLLLTGALLIYVGWPRSGRSPLALPLLGVVATLELLTASAGLNPVMPADRLGPPDWATATTPHRADRFYFGGKFRGTLWPDDIDLRGIQWQAPQQGTVEEGRTLLMANLAMTPAAWGMRELLSYDLPLLWPVEYTQALTRFEAMDRPARMRFLARGGVRYCLLSTPPDPEERPLRPVGERFGSMAVYECVPDTRRVLVVADALVVPSVTTQIERLFDEAFDDRSTVMLEQTAPAAAGVTSAPSTASARLTTDGDREVVVTASAGAAGGYLVLRDSFDRGWQVDVDDQPATLLRADGLYRAVRISSGTHTVRFRYRPQLFYVSALASGLAVLALVALATKRTVGHTAHAWERGTTATA